jgi:hypothetical protein
MVVAETLAGLSLINASVKAIKGAIGTAKDISVVADQIDDLFKGRKEIKKSSHPIAGRWDSFLHKTLGDSADKFSLGAIAKESIEEKLAEEQINRVRLMINRRFGPDTWTDILEERRRRIEEHTKEVKKQKLKKAETTQRLYKILETGVGVLLVTVGIIGVVFYINWIRK